MRLREVRKSFGVFALLIVAIAAICGLTASGASAGYWRHCGNQHEMGAGWYALRAHNLHCDRARSVANGFSFGTNLHPHGFSCQINSRGIELGVARCRRDAGRVQKVQFQYGA